MDTGRCQTCEDFNQHIQERSEEANHLGKILRETPEFQPEQRQVLRDGLLAARGAIDALLKRRAEHEKEHKKPLDQI